MKITILGCGTSTGVPVPACKCAVCKSPDPKNERLRASVLVQTSAEGAMQSRNIVIDTSPDFRQQSLRIGLERVDAVLYTHAHADHILGLDDLRSFNFAQKQEIPCYANKETKQAIESIFSYVFKPDPEYKGGGLAKLKFYEFGDYEKLDILNNDVQSFVVMHGNSKVSGFRIGNFAYATDCNLINDYSYQYLQNLDLLILDGLRYEPHPTHFTIPEAIEVSRKINAKKTLLTHYTHNIDYNLVNPVLPEGIELAYDQMVIEI